MTEIIGINPGILLITLYITNILRLTIQSHEVLKSANYSKGFSVMAAIRQKAATGFVNILRTYNNRR